MKVKSLFNKDIKSYRNTDYVEAYNKIETYCSGYGGLVMLGRFGEVGTPSISDLDVLIVLTDTDYINARSEILKFIKFDPDLSYLFVHEPLIIPNSILDQTPYLHSLENLILSYNPDNLQFSVPSKNYIELLQILWTTFLVPIAISILQNPHQFGVRFVFHVIKNLQTSAVNLAKITNIHPLPDEDTITIRKEFLDNRKGCRDVYDFLELKLNQIFSFFDVLSQQRALSARTNVMTKSIPINWTTTARFSRRSGYEASSRNTNIFLSEYLYWLLIQLGRRRSTWQDLQIYIDCSLAAFSKLKSMQVDYPFIFPFGYRFYRDGFLFKIKKFFLTYCKPIILK